MVVYCENSQGISEQKKKYDAHAFGILNKNKPIERCFYFHDVRLVWIVPNHEVQCRSIIAYFTMLLNVSYKNLKIYPHYCTNRFVGTPYIRLSRKQCNYHSRPSASLCMALISYCFQTV